jgi:hypothetical protein
MNILTWSASGSLAINALTVATNAPEGRQVAQAVVSRLWGGWGIFNVASPGSYQTIALDYSDYAGGALRFWLQSQDELEVQIEYLTADGHASDVKVTQVIPSTGGVWKEIVVPLSSFPSFPAVQTGLNLGQIIGPFLISTSSTSGATTASKSFEVDDVRWTKPLAGVAVYPSSSRLNPGQHRQFTIEGVSSNGEPVYVYGNFSTSAGLGVLSSVSAAGGMSSVLQGGQTSGSLFVMATNPPGTISGSASVTLTAANLQREFGVVSDTRTNLTLDTDSEMVVFFGGAGVTAPLITSDISDFVEGSFSVMTTVNLTGADAYAGWSIQISTNAPPSTTNTVDMSDFYDGVLRFSLKAPAALSGAMTVGVRSANVLAGTELSQVSLNNYATFDNQWHGVAVPISAFAGSRPWADLARMQDLFTIAANGNVGSQNFHVDNARWDSGITKANSGLRVTQAIAASPDFRLTVSGPPGLAYAIEPSSNLTTWTNLLYEGVLDATPFVFVHSNALHSAKAFYRLVGFP